MINRLRRLLHPLAATAPVLVAAAVIAVLSVGIAGEPGWPVAVAALVWAGFAAGFANSGST
ncbi:hypothetical protein [Phytoactinopolyspora limicola]|uniref:hypothetical protein n=1 Tax=Phytoactinopolyspora limicola TaxID=2715536 RepID=UPI00140CE0CD|nr:hypothetical protein [Phytoactinopolyspora limicola]